MPDRPAPAPPGLDGTVVLVTREGMGSGEPELQRALMQKYVSLLLAGDLIPRAMCFYTEGVQLVVEGSPLLDALAALERRGCRLLVCSSCLEYYALRERVRVGTVGGMPDILDAQLGATRVITL